MGQGRARTRAVGEARPPRLQPDAQSCGVAPLCMRAAGDLHVLAAPSSGTVIAARVFEAKLYGFLVRNLYPLKFKAYPFYHLRVVHVHA